MYRLSNLRLYTIIHSYFTPILYLIVNVFQIVELSWNFSFKIIIEFIKMCSCDVMWNEVRILITIRELSILQSKSILELLTLSTNASEILNG